MNKRIFRLIEVIILNISFALTVLALFMNGHNTTPFWSNVHIIAGGLMLMTSLLHLITHASWLRSVLSRPLHSLSRETRRNRNVDFALIFMGLLCGLSGWLQVLTSVEALGHLHAISGFLMILLLFIHMLLHQRWMVNQIRSLFSNGSVHKESVSEMKTDL